MGDNITIKLIPSAEISSVIPLLCILNTTISERVIQERLGEMVGQGYKCVGAFSENNLIGICGLWILTKYYVGKHIEPDNMVILPEYRSMGLGARLMAWVYEYAKSQGCVASELNCYLSNEKGHAFWEREGYKKIAYHFQKKFA